MKTLYFNNPDQMHATLNKNLIHMIMHKNGLLPQLFEFIHVGGIKLTRFTGDWHYSVQGVEEKHHYTFLIILDGEMHANGQRICRDDILFRPPSSEFLTSSNNFHKGIGISVPVNCFTQLFAETVRNQKANFTSILSCSPLKMRALRSLLQDLFLTHRNFQETKKLEVSYLNNLSAQIVFMLEEIILPCIQNNWQGMHSSHHKHMLFQNALKICNMQLSGNIDFEEMSRKLNISRRNLHNLFIDHLGHSPMRYLNFRRLNLVREALLGIQNKGQTIAEVASRHGFWHFGRFASTYKKFFGELPSETLANSAKKQHCKHLSWNAQDHFFFR